MVGSNEVETIKVRKLLSRGANLNRDNFLLLLEDRFLPLAGLPENRCSWVLRIYTQFFRCQDIPSYS